MARRAGGWPRTGSRLTTKGSSSLSPASGPRVLLFPRVLFPPPLSLPPPRITHGPGPGEGRGGGGSATARPGLALGPAAANKEEAWQPRPEESHQRSVRSPAAARLRKRSCYGDWPAPRRGRGPERPSHFSFPCSGPCWRRESEAAPALNPFILIKEARS